MAQVGMAVRASSGIGFLVQAGVPLASLHAMPSEIFSFFVPVSTIAPPAGTAFAAGRVMLEYATIRYKVFRSTVMLSIKAAAGT